MSITPLGSSLPVPTPTQFRTDYTPAELAGLAPTDADISQARRDMLTAYLVFAVGAGCLLIAVAIRFYALADRLPDLTGAAWAYGMFVAAALAVGAWVSVELHSQGSEFGDLLAEQRKVDRTAVEEDTQHGAEVRGSLDTARDQVNYGNRALADYQAGITDSVHVFMSGLQLAASVLQCPLPTVNHQYLIQLDRQTIDHLERVLAKQGKRTTEMEADAEASYLPVAPTWQSTYTAMHTPAPVNPNPNHIGPGVPPTFKFGPPSLRNP